MNKTYVESKSYPNFYRLSRSIPYRTAPKLFFKKVPKYWLGYTPAYFLFILSKKKKRLTFFYRKEDKGVFYE